MISRTRAWVILIVGLCLGVLVIFQILIPVKGKVSNRYLIRGDSYLLNRQFENAAEEYQKSLSFNPQNQSAKTQLELAKKGPIDIALLKNFYQSRNNTTIVAEITQAEVSYTKPKEALEAGVKYYSNNQFVYAQYPLRKAVQLDPGYPEAWHYLGLTYIELAKIDPELQKKADIAWAQRDRLTLNYR